MIEFVFAALVKDFIKNAQNDVHNFTKRGKCIKCGECCSNFLPLADSEIEIIRSYVNEHNIKPQSHSHNNNVLDALCPFLSRDRKCLIYDFRPLICRSFKCNQKSPTEKHLRLFLREKRHILDVRDTFFKSEEATHEL